MGEGPEPAGLWQSFLPASPALHNIYRQAAEKNNYYFKNFSV